MEWNARKERATWFVPSRDVSSDLRDNVYALHKRRKSHKDAIQALHMLSRQKNRPQGLETTSNISSGHSSSREVGAGGSTRGRVVTGQGGQVASRPVLLPTFPLVANEGDHDEMPSTLRSRQPLNVHAYTGRLSGGLQHVRTSAVFPRETSLTLTVAENRARVTQGCTLVLVYGRLRYFMSIGLDVHHGGKHIFYIVTGFAGGHAELRVWLHRVQRGAMDETSEGIQRKTCWQRWRHGEDQPRYDHSNWRPHLHSFTHTNADGGGQVSKPLYVDSCCP